MKSSSAFTGLGLLELLLLCLLVPHNDCSPVGLETTKTAGGSLSGIKPSSCAEWKLLGFTQSGQYTVYPRVWYGVLPFDVYCDMHTEGGGWTVFQRRGDYGEPRENFYRNWNDYKDGFGKLTQEFWLGNDYISVLTHQDEVTLRIDLEDFEGEKRYAVYEQFQLSSATTDYIATIDKYSGTAGDSFSGHKGVPFVTYDKNDNNTCSKLYKGGWWYTKCHVSNLNGLYLKGPHESYADGVNWRAWKEYHYSLKMAEMKVRPTSCRRG